MKLSNTLHTVGVLLIVVEISYITIYSVLWDHSNNNFSYSIIKIKNKNPILSIKINQSFYQFFIRHTSELKWCRGNYFILI
jgi:uncharacterized membrane protein